MIRVTFKNLEKALMAEIEKKLNNFHEIKKELIQKPKFSKTETEPDVNSKAFAFVECVKVSSCLV